MHSILPWAAFVCALVPCCLFIWNLVLYRKPRNPATGWTPSISVLIPARNEERSIEGAVRAALRSTNVDLEVIVLDDHSEDRTNALVAAIQVGDERVRLENAPPLPDGWCGKQFACYRLSQLATKPLFCFVDADVRLAPDALKRIAWEMQRRRAALISGFPRQETKTLLEQALIPLMHFMLLGYLPLAGMRRSGNPGFAAGCGQLMLVERSAYLRAGAHETIRLSKHDGLTLPKAFRRAGLSTDLCDVTDLATCRMYTSASEVINGLLKNATEGIAAPARILPFTVLLLLGQVVPFVFLILHNRMAIAVAAIVCIYVPRLIAAMRFRQTLLGALMHPFSILLLLALQWWALARQLTGAPSSWKGRNYPAATAP